MSLSWFPFNIKDFLANTKRLNTEAKGAYLCLMLDYYEQESGPPDDDEVLATICELPLESWRRHRKVIEPFFEVVGGRWVHHRIDEEIKEGEARQAAYAKRAKKGGDARWSSKRDASSIDNAQSKLCLEDQQETRNNITLSLAREDLEEKVVESGENKLVPRMELKEDQWLEAGPPPVEKPLTPIDPQFQPPADVRAECLSWMDASTFHVEWQKFVFDAREKGKLSADWDASLRKWMERFREYANRPSARGKPRVQLNPDPPAGDEQTAAINWSWHLSRWLKSESTWSRRTAGPEPGQAGCRVPTEMLEKFNIDAATGRKKQTEPT